MNGLRLLGTYATEPNPAIPEVPTSPVAAPGETAPSLPAGIPSAGDPTYYTVTDVEGASTGTLPIQPENTFRLTVLYTPPTVFEGELGYESVQQTSGASRYSYELIWHALTLADRDTLIAFFKANKIWDWVAPGQGSRKFTLVTAQLPREYLSPGSGTSLWQLQGTAVEIR